MGTTKPLSDEISISPGREHSRLKFFQIAFIVQVILLLLIVTTMGFVSWQFNAKQRNFIQSNVDLANELQQWEKSLKQQQDNYVVLATQSAFEIQNISRQHLTDKDIQNLADRELHNALDCEPGSWLAWRDEAQQMIEEHRPQEALAAISKAPIDKTDGRNLFTEAMLQCAIGQRATAMDLKSKAQQSPNKPSPAELESLDAICH